jgi:hypothetical protein
MTILSLRIDQDLSLQAEHEARIQNRSKTKQLEYWAKLGKAVSRQLWVLTGGNGAGKLCVSWTIHSLLTAGKSIALILFCERLNLEISSFIIFQRYK